MLSSVQLVTSAGLLVLIWLIQVLHYPAFAYFDSALFAEAMAFHQTRITYVVLPLMLLELGVSIALAVQRPLWPELTALACVVLIWLSTFFVQVPIHGKLVSYDAELIRQLVSTNWVRTVLWSIKFALVYWAYSLAPKP